jgi:hypothetical protein
MSKANWLRITPEQEAADATLKELNRKVLEVVAERTSHLNDNMALFAEFQIGDEVVNVSTGQRGVVREHTRFHQKSNPLYDTSFGVVCHILWVDRNGNAGNNPAIDNTSHYAGGHPYVLASLDRKSDEYIQALEQAARRAVR